MCFKMTDNCRETKKVARFKGTLVFTDAGDRQVKWYNPSTKKVETIAGDGSEGVQDETSLFFMLWCESMELSPIASM